LQAWDGDSLLCAAIRELEDGAQIAPVPEMQTLLQFFDEAAWSRECRSQPCRPITGHDGIEYAQPAAGWK